VTEGNEGFGWRAFYRNTKKLPIKGRYMEFDRRVLDAFPGICVAEGTITDVHIKKENQGLQALKVEVAKEIQSRYSLESVRNEPVFRAYRDFFWSVGVDPTKTRPASEALVRRILSGGVLPRINTAVDSYNLASAVSGIPIAAFDRDMVKGDLFMRFADEGEEFIGIGMKKPVILAKNQVILLDSEQIVAIYPYRDSDSTKVRPDTKTLHIVTCGVPKIEREVVLKAYETCAGFLREHAGGLPSMAEISP
jgi:DNA/RNA-binding domain of Phe-tRNA-synthetase-like protein